MIPFFSDTSFLFAVYREQENSAATDEWMEFLPAGTLLSPLVLVELRNSFRLNVGWFLRDRTKGFPSAIAEKALGDLETDIEAGIWSLAVVDWPQVWALAEQLSKKHTAEGLHRGMDLLHVATAKHFQTANFLTFDENQATLARKAGMKTPLKIK